MNLPDAIRLVIKDTKEVTDPSMSDREAITCARQDITLDDLADYDDRRLAEAYRTVLTADQAAIDAAVR